MEINSNKNNDYQPFRRSLFGEKVKILISLTKSFPIQLSINKV
jgi:hypothetical protein